MNISVYITSYNQKHYLIDAIESVLAQTLRPSQVIIIDDCSSDGSQEVIAGYAARYPEIVTPIYHEQNQGIARTRSDALLAVTGDYVTYVDGDDRFLATKLEKEAQTLAKNPRAQIAFSNNFYMDHSGRHIGIWSDRDKPPEGNILRQTFARDFPRRNLFRMELVNFSVWRRVGFHDLTLNLYEDWDMRIRLSQHCQVAYYDEPLTEIRVHHTGLSSSKAADHLAAVTFIYRKHNYLLRQFSLHERREIRNALGRWIASLVRQAITEALVDKQNPRESRRRAFRCFLHLLAYNPNVADIALGVRILLPNSIYSRTSVIYRQATAVASRSGHR